jgi:DNA-directed RNA polymerase subunit beta'
VTITEKLEVTGFTQVVIDRERRIEAAHLDQDPQTGETRRSPASGSRPVPASARTSSLKKATTTPAKSSRRSRATTKVQDITGGCPRRRAGPASRKITIISEIDGEVSMGKDTKGKRKVVITRSRPKDLFRPTRPRVPVLKGKHIQVQPGDRARR